MNQLTEDLVRITICAPLRSDADLLLKVLRDEGFEAGKITTGEFNADIVTENTVLLLTQEALTNSVRKVLSDLVASQAPWEHLPIILLLEREQENSEVTAALSDLLVHGLVTILHRPLRPLELTTAVHNAVTARSRQLEIRDYINQEKELQRELNHRVKNTFATFQAVYQMSMRQSTTLEEFSERFTNRIQALGVVNELLDSSRTAERNIESIILAITAPYTEKNPRHLEIHGPLIALSRQTAFTFALIINELATNAAKYGALSEPEGRLLINWRLETGESTSRTVRLVWTETGGPAVTKPGQPGYGTRFINSTVRSMRGSVDFDFRNEGLQATLDLPILTDDATE